MVLFLLTLTSVLCYHLLPTNAQASVPPAIIGRLVDPQGEPVRGADVRVYVNSDQEPLAAAQSQADGVFLLDLSFRPINKLRVEITRPHFQAIAWSAAPQDLESLSEGATLRLPDMIMGRRITAGFWVAALAFASFVILVASGRLHNTMAALLALAIILGVSLVGRALDPDLFIFGFDEALEYVDFEVVFLVMGMMIVIGILGTTGLFPWMAYQAYRFSQGRPWTLVAILMLLTSALSAVLENVTTMLLVAPITMEIALSLGIDPLSLIVPEVLACNIGGITTLIGTSANILIGSYADISFTDFLVNLTPGVLMAQAVLTIYVLLIYRAQYRAAGAGLSPAMLERLRSNGRITQPETLRKAGVIFIVMLLLFATGQQIHIRPALTALLGAVAMLLLTPPNVREMLEVVDWTTLMFFVALFMVVGAIREVGLVGLLASAVKGQVGENLDLALLGITWVSAFLSSAIDNIPLTATLLPVVGFLSRTIPGADSKVLFFGLSAGSAMGCNSSPIGASANIVTLAITERAGYRISYGDFVRVSLPAMVLTLGVATAWLLVRFA
jgi:Na+/H+ antiporter NhaD/arsenite permease-like protein